MKIILPIRYLLILLFIIPGTGTFSQVVVERSQNKVIISGIQYYIHSVKKGETAYSVSRAYGIKVEELVRENPPALYGLNEGQSLRIPVSSVEAADAAPVAQPVKRQRDEANFIYHTLNPGETIYYLSKLYGVSENEIMQSNQGLDINKLSVGTEIAVPRRKFMPDRQKFEISDKKYIYHRVKKGETLNEIARNYSLTVKELRRENRDLRFPQEGDYLRIPSMMVPEVAEFIQDQKDTVATPVAEEIPVVVRPAGYTELKKLTGSLDVAVLLPFYLKENAARSEIDSSRMVKGRKIYKEIKRPEDWIYPGSIDFVEMYEGILLAADTLRSLGLDINISAFDIKSDTVELTRLMNSGRLAEMDLIIGPVYSRNLARLSSYAALYGIPVVSPVPLFNNSVLEENPTLFLASATLEVAQKKLAKKISEYPSDNFVLIHSDSLGVDEDVSRFRSLIIRELTNWIPYDELKFRELLFFSRSKFDNDSINRLSHALSDQTDNVVIIASEDPSVISESLMDVHGLLKNFNIKVFGYPVMREIENLDPNYFFDLDLKIYSPSWIDYSKDDVKQFNADFRTKFLTQPSEISFAWQGYDIAYFFISGLALHGTKFITDPLIHNPDLLHTQFWFSRKINRNGFENQSLFLIHYSKEFDVKMIPEQDN